MSSTFSHFDGLSRKRNYMKTQTSKERVKELVNYLKDYDKYQELFREIDKDIKIELEKERFKRMRMGYRKR